MNNRHPLQALAFIGSACSHGVKPHTPWMAGSTKGGYAGLNTEPGSERVNPVAEGRGFGPCCSKFDFLSWHALTCRAVPAQAGALYLPESVPAMALLDRHASHFIHSLSRSPRARISQSDAAHRTHRATVS